MSNVACAVMLLMLVVILTAGTIFLSPDKSHAGYYIAMLMSIGFLSGGASNRIGYADFL